MWVLLRPHDSEEPIMQVVTTIGLDIAKSVFQVHGVDAEGKVIIGALVAHRESDHWAVDALGAPHVGERTEKQLISALCDKIAAVTPQLVSDDSTAPIADECQS